ncbi:MAG: hypothetical protein RLZZ156_2175 [Deinococcota bacterium]|jgi:hypothetical protein
MKKFVLLLLLCLSVARASDASLKVMPAANLERGLTVVQGQQLEFRVSPGIEKLQTVTLNITRGGRVMGEYAMRQEGADYVAKLPLELPYAHIVTVRLYQDSRVWSSALDLTALQPEDAKLVPNNSSFTQALNFSVTEGKAGGDANPLWGIFALAILGAGVFIGTRGKKKPKVMPNA